MSEDQPILFSSVPLPVALSRRFFFVLLCVPAFLCHEGADRLCCAEMVVVLGRPGGASSQRAMQVAAPRVGASMGKREGSTDVGNPQINLSWPTILGVPNDGEMGTPLTKRGDKISRNLCSLDYIQKSKVGVGIFSATSIKGIFVG